MRATGGEGGGRLKDWQSLSKICGQRDRNSDGNSYVIKALEVAAGVAAAEGGRPFSWNPRSQGLKQGPIYPPKGWFSRCDF